MSNRNRLAKLASAVALLAGGLLAVPATALAAPAQPACGGEKGGKDVKKPKGDQDDQKRPTQPATVELCGDNKGGKDVKKPQDDKDDKRPKQPA
jgi:hypothetical protein